MSRKFKRKDPNRWTEAKVVKEAKKIFELHAPMYIMRVIKTKFNNNGEPDFVMGPYGWFVAIEFKCGYNKPTPLQQGKLDEVQDAGGIPLVINEKNLGALARMLEIIKETSMTTSPEVIQKQVGAILRRARENRDIKAATVFPEVGVSKATFSRYELGSSVIPLPVFYRICEIYELKPSKVLDLAERYIAEASGDEEE